MFKLTRFLQRLSEVERGHYKHNIDPAKIERPHWWEPRMFILKTPLPGIKAGAIFRQTYQSDNIYFYGIPISGNIPEHHQVGIIQFEAQYVENNPEWFIDVVEQRIIDDIRNDSERFFYE